MTVHFAFDYEALSQEGEEIAKAFCRVLSERHAEWDVTWTPGATYLYAEDRFSAVFCIIGAMDGDSDIQTFGRAVVDAFGPAMANVEQDRAQVGLGTLWPHGRLRFWSVPKPSC